MDKLTEYILNIAVYTVLTGFVSIILPDNCFRKYTALIMGIILVKIVLEPLGKGLLPW